MKARELRNSVLQLAIQGKLVPQDENDEPASILLEKIEAEKKKLIKEGKIKKQKPLPTITDEEKPFDIPNSWKWVRLGEVGDWGSGATPSRGKLEYYENGTIPWLKTGDLTDGYIITIPEKITDLALRQTSVRLNPAGSILVAMYGATIGKTGILNYPATTNQACCACNPYRGLFNLYLFEYLLSQKENLKKRSEGGAQPNISKEKIVNYLFPLPPLEEQQRIVSKIEEIMPLIDEYEKLETEVTKLEEEFPDKLKKSILQYAVKGKLIEQNTEEEPASVLLEKIGAEKKQLIKEGKIKKQKPLPPITDEEKPFDIPDSWEWVRLGEVCNYGQKGSVKPSNINDETWVLELEDIEKNTSTLLKKKYNKERKTKSTKNIFNKGDLLYGKLRPYLNKMIVADESGVCSTEIMPFKMYTECNIKYASLFMQAPITNYTINNITHGMDMPRLGTENARSLIFPLPPIEEQKRIVEKVDELFSVVGVLADEKVLRSYSIDKINKVVDIDFGKAAMPSEDIKIAARGKENKNDLEMAKEIFEEL